MIDTLVDTAITNYPYVGLGATLLAGGIFLLRKYHKKTKTTFDDKILKSLDESGFSKLVSRFNPFK